MLTWFRIGGVGENIAVVSIFVHLGDDGLSVHNKAERGGGGKQRMQQQCSSGCPLSLTLCWPSV